MLSIPESLIGASALSLMEGRSRREWKLTLQTLKLIDVGWSELLKMSASEAWQWLGWDAARFREWNSALEITQSRLSSGQSDIRAVSELDSDVPSWLQNLPAVPWVFYRGDISTLDQKTIGFSGQRDAGNQSLAIATSLGVEAARQAFTVVSGGARGIDMAAHAAVLNEGGFTAVILPQGLSNWTAPHTLTNPNVLAISEDIPWDGWTTESAMRRNRMIVDVSDIFTVPQSGTSGGSHSTGMYALRQGHMTYVPDLGPNFPGNRKLLHSGARPLVFENYHFDLEQMYVESTPKRGPEQAMLF